MTWREIIIIAFERSRICPRKRVLPADLYTDGIELLRGVLTELSSQDYIVPYTGERDVTVKDQTIYLGEFELGDETHIQIANLQEVNNVLVKEGEHEYTKMNFYNVEDFYTNIDAYGYTKELLGQGLWCLKFRPNMVNRTIKILFNKAMEFQDDENVRLPDITVEMIIRCLSEKIALKHNSPNKDNLSSEVANIKAIVRSNTSTRKYYTRDTGKVSTALEAVRSGSFIFQ